MAASIQSGLEPVALVLLLVDEREESTKQFKDDLIAQGYDPDVVQIRSREGLMQWLTTPGQVCNAIVANHRVDNFEAKDVLEVVKKLNLDVPVILLTNPGQEKEKAPLFRLGAFGSIAKDEVDRIVPIIEQRMRDRKELNALKEEIRENTEKREATVSALEVLRDEKPSPPPPTVGLSLIAEKREASIATLEELKSDKPSPR